MINYLNQVSYCLISVVTDIDVGGGFMTHECVIMIDHHDLAVRRQFSLHCTDINSFLKLLVLAGSRVGLDIQMKDQSLLLYI
jgi:hypothetical protein